MKLTVLVIMVVGVVLGFPIQGLTQINVDSIQERYPFLQTQLNELTMYKDSAAMHRLFEKIYRIQHGSQEQVHIIHIGGSHVQAGIMSERLRQRFRSLFDPHQVGERGFFFPYTLAGTNNPWDYTIEYTGEWTGCRNAVRDADCTWGLAGIVASTEQPYSTIKVEAKDHILGRSTFCSARVYYDVEKSPFNLQVISWDCPVYEVTDTLAGYTEWQFESEQRDIEIRLVPLTDTVVAGFSIEGIQLKTGYPGVSLHAIGVNGASVPSYLRCEKFAQQLCLLKPDLIIFGIGVNDANSTQKGFNPLRFEEHYDQLLSAVCDCDRDIATLFLTNNDTYYRKRYPNKNALEVREVMNRLAMRYGGAVYDLFGVMGGLQSIQQWQKAGLAKRDYIHFTNDGYKLAGDLIFAAFEKQYVTFANHLETIKE